MFTKLKKGQVVINTKTKQTGKVIGFEGAITVVEVILSQNKEEGTRTTKLERFNTIELQPYVNTHKKKGYNPYFDVREFHKAFNHPAPNEPTPLTPERAAQRTDYLVEEAVEFLWATVAGDEARTEMLVDELVRNIYKAMNKCFGKGEFPEDEILLHQTDASIDISYINYGTLVEMGVNPKNVFEIVQSANMAKLDENGKPIIDPVTKKIMKPEGWEENHQPEPLIKKELERQIEQAQKRQSQQNGGL